MIDNGNSNPSFRKVEWVSGDNSPQQTGGKKTYEYNELTGKWRCTMCLVEKPLTPDYFYRQTKTKTGYKYYCKECCAKTDHALYLNKMEQIKRHVRLSQKGKQLVAKPLGATLSDDARAQKSPAVVDVQLRIERLARKGQAFLGKQLRASQSAQPGNGPMPASASNGIPAAPEDEFMPELPQLTDPQDITKAGESPVAPVNPDSEADTTDTIQ